MTWCCRLHSSTIRRNWVYYWKRTKGKTAWELAFEKYGKDETWAIIENFFEDTRDVRIVERNPATNVYPFMIAAAGESSDLSTVYYFLRRHPEVLYRTGGQG